MSKPECRKCLLVQVFVLVVLLGGGAGFAAIQAGGGRQLSMLATFLGAMLPLMWYVRRTRGRRDHRE